MAKMPRKTTPETSWSFLCNHTWRTFAWKYTDYCRKPWKKVWNVGSRFCWHTENSNKLNSHQPQSCSCAHGVDGRQKSPRAEVPHLVSSWRFRGRRRRRWSSFKFVWKILNSLICIMFPIRWWKTINYNRRINGWLIISRWFTDQSLIRI